MHTRALAALLCAAVGCERELSFGQLLVEGEMDASRVEAGAPASDGGFSGEEAAAPDARDFCARREPLFTPTDLGSRACAVSSPGFHYGLCSCGIVQSNALLRVDGFDSRAGAYRPESARGGTLALHGGLYAPAEIGGSLSISSALGATPAGDLTVGGSFTSLGPLVAGGRRVQVGGDVRIAGSVSARELAIGGTLTLPDDATVQVESGAPPTTSRAAVTLDPPCRCDAQLDLATALEEASRDNDNARIGLVPSRAFTSDGAVRELPCGRYFVESLLVASPLTLRIQGRVALYVRKSVVTQDVPFAIELAPDAQLDLVIGEGFSANGEVAIGDPVDPTRTRMFVGGAGSGGTLYFFGALTLSASLYAPTAELRLARQSNQPALLYGAALVESLTALPPLDVHYDRALGDAACIQ